MKMQSDNYISGEMVLNGTVKKFIKELPHIKDPLNKYIFDALPEIFKKIGQSVQDSYYKGAKPYDTK